MNLNSKIYIAGHTGLVGSALHEELISQGYTNIVTRIRKYLDLTNQRQVAKFFEEERPQYVFLCAAKVGGILGNSEYPADFITQNLQIQTNIIESAHIYPTQKLVFLGSSCVYPRLCPQPIKESYLLTAPLEPTNEAYAIAKITGIMMCKKYKEQYEDNFVSVMPCNLYGENDNFDPKNSHVIPALINRFMAATKYKNSYIEVWGSGKPKREFLHVKDLAKALVAVMQKYDDIEPINIGSGSEISIRDLAYLIAKLTGYKGDIVFNTEKPDGTPRKILDNSKIKGLGWEPSIHLNDGLKEIIDSLSNYFV